MRFGLRTSLRELFWLTLVAALLLDRWRLCQRLEDFRDESEYFQSLVTVRDHQFKTYWHMMYSHATEQQGRSYPWDSQEAYDKLVELSHPIRQEDCGSGLVASGHRQNQMRHNDFVTKRGARELEIVQ